MRSLLICHHDELLNRELLPLWMASFSDLEGILVIRDNRRTLAGRFKREFKRLGPWRIFDALAFRLFYRFAIARHDRRWEEQFLDEHRKDYPGPLADIPILETADPNSREAMSFLKDCRPDLVLARCKHLLKPSIFGLPTKGTYVLHPGICPEYRNAHGCFWALVGRDTGKVGATLLKVDRGIDTGPIYNYFSCQFDERNESHIRIQERVVFENLNAIKSTLLDIATGNAEPIDTSTRPSGNWGQPLMSAWLRWKRAARRNHRTSK